LSVIAIGADALSADELAGWSCAGWDEKKKAGCAGARARSSSLPQPVKRQRKLLFILNGYPGRG